MDLYQVLISEHRDIHDRIERMTKTREGLDTAFFRLFQDLQAHMEFEEKFLYPVLRQNPDDREDVLEAFEEHALARFEAQSMEQTPMEDERWRAKLQVLGEVLDHHISEEEGTLFPEARKLLSASKAQEILSHYDDVKQECLIRT